MGREEPPDEPRESRARVVFYRGLFFSSLLLLLATSALVYLWAMDQIGTGGTVAP